MCSRRMDNWGRPCIVACPRSCREEMQTRHLRYSMDTSKAHLALSPTTLGSCLVHFRAGPRVITPTQRFDRIVFCYHSLNSMTSSLQNRVAKHALSSIHSSWSPLIWSFLSASMTASHSEASSSSRFPSPMQSPPRKCCILTFPPSAAHVEVKVMSRDRDGVIIDIVTVPQYSVAVFSHVCSKHPQQDFFEALTGLTTTRTCLVSTFISKSLQSSLYA